MSTERILFYVGNISWGVVLISLIVATVYNVVRLHKEEREEE